MAYTFHKLREIEFITRVKTPFIVGFCLCYLFAAGSVASQSLNQDAALLLRMKPLLGDQNNLVLSSWNQSNHLCSWQRVEWMITSNGSILNCSSAETSRNFSITFDSSVAVYALDLGSAGLFSGIVPPELGLLLHLQRLNMSNNSLTGSLPSAVGDATKLMYVHLSYNRLTGSISGSTWKLCNMLTELELDNNLFSEIIAPSISPGFQCFSLKKLSLNNNKFSGPIPDFLGNFLGLTELNLSNNSFTGQIPKSLTQLKNLRSGVDGLSLAYNNLSGPIPLFSENFNATSFSGNSPFLCAKFLSNPCDASLAPSPNQPGRIPKLRGPSPRAVAGIIIGVLVLAVGLLSLCIGVGSTKYAFSRKLVSSSLRTDLEDADAGSGKLVHFEGGEHLTSDDVLNAAGDILGKTSYGTVYKAKLSTGSTIALRLLRDGTVREQCEFVPAIEELGCIRHQNLVPLRAFYSGHKGEKLLAYDYLSKGNLSDLLHKAGPREAALSWGRRHKIALGVARGLGHLHTHLHTPVIHGNLKARNVLVDENYGAHLSDYGLHMLMTPAASNDVMNAAREHGYKAPEFIKMRKANVKTDIYSFGIILLEILTGKKPGKMDASDKVMDLPLHVKTAVLEEHTFELFETELVRGLKTPAEDGLLQALRLAMGCSAPSPSVRPDIKEVIKQLEEIRPKNLSPLFTPPDNSSQELYSRYI